MHRKCKESYHIIMPLYYTMVGSQWPYLLCLGYPIPEENNRNTTYLEMTGERNKFTSGKLKKD